MSSVELYSLLLNFNQLNKWLKYILQSSTSWLKNIRPCALDHVHSHILIRQCDLAWESSVMQGMADGTRKRQAKNTLDWHHQARYWHEFKRSRKKNKEWKELTYKFLESQSQLKASHNWKPFTTECIYSHKKQQLY